MTTQQQILALLRELARHYDVAMLFVTHDFGVVADLCDAVTVMYAGQTIERAPTRLLIDAPLHPYTQRLIACHPDRGGALIGIPGIVPAATAMPSGCRFHPRCPQVMPECSAARPGATRIAAEQRSVRCYLYPASVPQGANAG